MRARKTDAPSQVAPRDLPPPPRLDYQFQKNYYIHPYILYNYIITYITYWPKPGKYTSYYWCFLPNTKYPPTTCYGLHVMIFPDVWMFEKPCTPVPPHCGELAVMFASRTKLLMVLLLHSMRTVQNNQKNVAKPSQYTFLETGSHCVAQTSLELVICRPRPPASRVLRWAGAVPPHPDPCVHF